MDLKGRRRRAAACAVLLAGLSWAALAGCGAVVTPTPAPAAILPSVTASGSLAPTQRIEASPAPAQVRPTQTAARCSETRGKLESLSLPTRSLPRPLEVQVYLPPCYSASPPEPYAVLLLLHGQAAQGDQWVRLGIPATADRLIAAGEIEPLLIVMPYEQDSLQNPFETGFDRALLEDLIPYVDEQYATCGGRECRAIGGLSRGAAWAMYLGLSHPEVFSAIGAHSFPSFYGDAARLPYLLREIEPGQMPRIWMDSGEGDRYLSQARNYHESLEQNGVWHEWQVLPGEHDEAYWSGNVELYLKWYGRPEAAHR